MFPRSHLNQVPAVLWPDLGRWRHKDREGMPLSHTYHPPNPMHPIHGALHPNRGHNIRNAGLPHLFCVIQDDHMLVMNKGNVEALGSGESAVILHTQEKVWIRQAACVYSTQSHTYRRDDACEELPSRIQDAADLLADPELRVVCDGGWYVRVNGRWWLRVVRRISPRRRNACHP